MRVDNQDIVRMARQLRDEENATQHVSPWKRHRRFAVPAWLVAVPAAAVMGFVLGIWTNVGTQSGTPLTALVDTVYIKVNDKPDTAHAVASAHVMTPGTAVSASPSPRAAAVVPVRQSRPAATGRPMQSDRIRYDLLVKN